MGIVELLGTAASLSLLAGWRLYATVFAVGLAIKFGWWALPVKLAHLSVLTNEWVLGVAGVGFVCEFFADKIVWLDSLWDSIHTFIRPVGGALVAASVISPQDPAMQAVFFLLGGGLATLSHATKAGTRMVVNQSPEPFSNIAVSMAEEVVVAVGLWATMTHPYIVLGVSVVATVVFAFVVYRLWKLLRRIVARIRNWFIPAPEAAGA
jgi:Domain of unknown function (DUF4126)